MSRAGDRPHEVRATLFETGRGRVARCVCCGQLELQFGNALMTLGADDLETLLDALAAAERGADGGATLTLGESGCGWRFDAGELAELHRLVAGTRLLRDLAAPPPPRDRRARDLPGFSGD